MESTQAEIPITLPRYRCHKEVEALKIKAIEVAPGTQESSFATVPMIVPEDEGFAPFAVDWQYINKHKPEIGGYWVRYPRDGYQSWSPAEAFEEGYMRL
jgi:hypothetical protein